MIEFGNYLPEYTTSEHRRHYVQYVQHKVLINRKENLSLCVAWRTMKAVVVQATHFNLGTRRSWVASCMYPPVPAERDAWWDPATEWTPCGREISVTTAGN